MAHIIFEQIVETNMIKIVALDSGAMDFLVRINGNVRSIQAAKYQMQREEFCVSRGPLTA